MTHSGGRQMRLGRLALVAVVVLAGQIGWGTTAAEYRKLADAAVARGEYAQAAGYYRQEAAIYRRLGDVNGAKVEEEKAARWSTEIGLFLDGPVEAVTLSARSTGAKHEPVTGCYLGAYVENDDTLFNDHSGASREAAFGKVIQKPLATAFRYHYYGRPFPDYWARALRAQGRAPHISLEPRGSLAAVRDDAYLQGFARAAAACGGPIFLRFACEMNGAWTPYHQDPALYREKFRLVHAVMARHAPNVAMIWCVNHSPEDKIDAYYPGDDAVDWVGVNFYSVLYHDNSRARPAFHECPTLFLDYVYRKYAARKPIAICEYGASHFDTVERTEYPEIAALRFAQLFAALPRLYPRVKLINIFDNNNLLHAAAGRRLNNYCVTDHPVVLAAVRRAVAPDYFLSQFIDGPPPAQAILPQPLLPGHALAGPARLSAWVKSYDNVLTVCWALDGKELARLTTPGEYRYDLDTTACTPGDHTLTVTVLDRKGRTAGAKSVKVVVRK
jgi:hypothetical protein